MKSKRIANLGLYLFVALSLFSCSNNDASNKPADTKPKMSTADLRISASENDAEEDETGTINLVSGYLELGAGETKHVVGLRFNGVPIPQGAAIKSASIQFHTIRSGSEAASFVLYGGLNGAQTFSKSSENISSRVKTSASVTWSPAPWTKIGEAGPDQRTPDIAPIVREITERPDWNSGNSLVVIITGTGERVANAFDLDPATAALLHIEYSVDDKITIDQLSVEPKTANTDQDLAFTWSVSAPEPTLLKCSLDVNNDGTPEYESDNCEPTMQQTHAFTVPGHYLARLEVEGDKGTSRSATVPFTITTPDSTTLVAAGDMVCDPESSLFNGGEGTATLCRMKATSDLALQVDPDAVAIVGDTQYDDGQPWKFQKGYDLSWGRVKDITYPAVGNHEYKTPGAAGYFGYFGAAAGDPDKGYYSYNLGAWHIVVLNSNCTKVDGGCGPNSAQVTWLKRDLAAYPTKCTLAYWHHPLFSSGEIGSIDWSFSFWQTLYEAGAEIVLTGHDHHYERFAPQTADGQLDPERGIREFVVGNGGRNLTAIPKVVPNSDIQNSGSYGVLELTLHPDSYDWKFLPETGGTFTDVGSGTCH